MSFKTFKNELVENFNEFIKLDSFDNIEKRRSEINNDDGDYSDKNLRRCYLFTTDTIPDELWDTYVMSFEDGTNDIFRKRAIHDCSACRRFIKVFGNVVYIDPKTYEMKSIWDFTPSDDVYKPITKALSEYVKSKPIISRYVTSTSIVGTDHNIEMCEDGTTIKWEHLCIETIPSVNIVKYKDIGSSTSKYTSAFTCFKNSLAEINHDALDVVIELIEDNNLYRGDAFEYCVTTFKRLKTEYDAIPDTLKDNYIWLTISYIEYSVSHMKNNVIGTLLKDLTNDIPLSIAVKKYEDKTSGVNYKRPKPIYTMKMIEELKAKIEECGYTDSLARRFATDSDISIKNVLWANRLISKKEIMNDVNDVFKELEQDAKTNQVNLTTFDSLPEIDIDDFINNELPKTKELQILFTRDIAKNLVSLITSKNPDAKPMFKWGNNTSWAYIGNVADANTEVKKNVKSAGGKVDADIRFSIQWNDREVYNPDDYDINVQETHKRGNICEVCDVYYQSKKSRVSDATQDVDVIKPSLNVPAVENITWSDKNSIPNNYEAILSINNFTHRGGQDGFVAEVEIDSTVYKFEYRDKIPEKKYIIIGVLTKDVKGKIEFKPNTDILISTEHINVWGLETNTFVDVTSVMLSPNYWDGKSVGSKHFMFMINGCVNNEATNGFYNEFFNADFMEFRKGLEALGSKCIAEATINQASGVGFNSTVRSDVIAKIKDSDGKSKCLKITI